MEVVLSAFKNKKWIYLTSVAAFGTIVMINEMLDFGEKIIKTPLLVIMAVFIFSFLIVTLSGVKHEQKSE
ncbi:TPA: hypothetical protein HA249_03525 [Candidatus Woesearchaeota archaeon]|nr:MAG: hypothetical protein QT07_C0008G0029 [archaeon GW2011_AR16]HIG95933.1 hypothetical protein [Candidatus Woesearchaeota archaeon]HII89024.1 hypothetical protein [Candidatus Woesearchaeota archaeon]